MKEFVKIETEATANQNGNIDGWQTVSDQSPEYWSERAMQKLPLSELYHQNEGETPEEYRNRLKAIGELTLDEYNDKVPYKLAKQYPEGYPYGRVVGKQYAYGDSKQGYKFVELEPHKQDVKAVNAEKALADAATAKATGELGYTVQTPNVYSSQQEMARHYIGPLSYAEQTKQPGIFQHIGEERYSDDDADFVERQRRDFAKKDQRSAESEALRIAGKMFEGFFCPLVEQGFFDSTDGRPAAFMPTSEYDDFKHSADAAVVIPTVAKNQEGEVVPADIPICFDLSTGSGDDKIARIQEKYSEGHGFTELKYPATCSGRPLESMTNVPHFVLCLPRQKELGEFNASLAAGKPLTRDLQDLINFQLVIQSRYWMNYWDKQKAQGDQDADDKSQQFAGLSAYFGQRLFAGTNLDAKGRKRTMLDILQQHSRATRYLTQAILKA